MNFYIIQNNLNIKNDDFNIFYIPKNEEFQIENSIIINSYNYKTIHNIKFCRDNTKIELSLKGEYQENYNIEKETSLSLKLHQGSNKISFTSNQPFIYSYSIYDRIDEEIIEKNTDWKNERGAFSDLTITEVKDEGDNNNEISIKFIPNYLKSS